MAQGHLKTGALCCIIREIKRTTMDCEPYDADKFADEERKQRSDNVLRRYNGFYNDEVSGLSWGMPTSMEELQAISLSCAVDALICENMNIEYNMIAVDDIKDLIQRLYQQGRESIKNIKEFKDSADGVA